MPDTGQIYGLIPKIMADIGAISKNKRNQTQGYAFRGIDDMYNAIHGPLTKYGVFYTPKVVEKSVTERATKSGGVLFYTNVRMEFTFYAPDASCIQVVTIGEAMDTGDKSSNKAMSAALKYALMQLFCIPTEEIKDSEADTYEGVIQRDATGENVSDAGAMDTDRADKKNGEAVHVDAKPDQLSDDKEFRSALNSAMNLSGYDKEAKRRLVAMTCSKRNIKTVAELDLVARHRFIDAVNAGEMDKYLVKETADGI